MSWLLTEKGVLGRRIGGGGGGVKGGLLVTDFVIVAKVPLYEIDLSGRKGRSTNDKQSKKKKKK